jgi:two-component system response regulator AtoC
MNAPRPAPLGLDTSALLVCLDPGTAGSVSTALAARNIAVTRVGSQEEARTTLASKSITLVVAAYEDPRTFTGLCDACVDVPVVVVVTDSSETVIAGALAAGAVATLAATPLAADVQLALDRALSERGPRDDNDEEEPPPAPTLARALLGDSDPMKRLAELITRAAPSVATVLLRGETGTGKELAARALHVESTRRDGPFVKVHCAALPETLLESELFGYEKGAFTGATSRKPGRVELAEGGTLFLDEIGDISASTQVKLLRIVQDREYERLGGVQTIRANVRFVTATHRDLETMVKEGQFREDLFYRLNVVTLWLPPLRARRDDVPLLARQFCDDFAAVHGRKGARLEPDALLALRAERWPGNVRQLQNFVERLVVLSPSLAITADDVRREMGEQVRFKTQITGVAASRSRTDTTNAPAEPLDQALHTAEREAIQRALRHTGGNRTTAARVLGVSRATLYAKLAEHGIT